MLEMVPEASPVTRASSAWVTGSSPRPRSTSTTRRWLAGLSDAVEPGEWTSLLPPVAVMADTVQQATLCRQVLSSTKDLITVWNLLPSSLDH
jgi:hypothetical protein